MTYYHGTTYEAALNILRNGFEHDDTIWSCSDNCKIYMIQQDSDPDIADNVNMSLSAARIAAAHTASEHRDLVIFAFDIPNHIRDEYMRCDMSAPNMYDCWEIAADELTKLVAKHKIRMRARIARDAYSPMLRALYLVSIVNNDYYDLYDIGATSTEISILKQLAKSDVYCDDLHMYVCSYNELERWDKRQSFSRKKVEKCYL